MFTAKKHRAFTLVELIVVIVILSILATIAFLSFSNQSSSARDSTRMADMSNILKGLSIFSAVGGSYPVPDKAILIMSGATQMGYQGEAGATNLKMINLSAGGGKDPLDSKYYTYNSNMTKNKAQIVGFLENVGSYQLGLNPFDNLKQTFAQDYTNRYPYEKGDSLGVILSQTGAAATLTYTPLQDTLAAGTQFDTKIPAQTIGKVTVIDNSISSSSTLTPVSNTVFVGYVSTGSTVDIGSVAAGTFTLTATSVQAGNTTTITNNCTTAPTSYTSSDTSKATISGTTITAVAAGTTNITPVGGNCSDSAAKVLTVTTAANSCASSAAYSNASFVTGTPTMVNQTWQNTNSANPCYLMCNPGYGWNGTNCVSAPACVAGITEITLSNNQIWSCLNAGATVMWNGSTNPSECGGVLANCNSANMSWMGEFYQWGRNAPTTATWNPVGVYVANAWGGGTTTAASGTGGTVGAANLTLMQGPCNVGWHVPTMYEWRLACNAITGLNCATVYTGYAIFKSTLRLPTNGWRPYTEGRYQQGGVQSYYWSSTYQSGNNAFSLNVSNVDIYAMGLGYESGNGYSVRCIKN